ncbi:WD repeat-containing protein 52 [Temnothorax longispinosus]|uniref:WD repeat-containing protein 52 n=1 Tax=Temnothorax longispinosus TaxID=300112 RepID=A0A4S2KAU9_9HYME|nr:WD repeat-containing protein 52 [Temnothorax longispinosus]
MAGFDAGYIYEYPSPEITETVGEEPVKSTIIYDADDTELRSCLFYKGRKYLFLGMEHGQIRVCRWKPENYTDLSDYWILPMHDNYNGHIPKMILSHDQRILFTCGHDGNLFSYEINDDAPLEEIEFEKTKGTLSLPYASIEDIEEIDYASLEEMIQQAEYDRIATAAKQRKHQTLEILLKLSEEYSKILESVTDDEVQHYEEEQREEDKVETEEEIEVAKTKPIADFLKSVNYEDVDSSLGIQLNQMLHKKLDKLERDRLDIVAENVNLNLFLLTLRQEYIILKEYETMENVLHDQVNRRSEEVAAMRQKIQTATDKVDIKTKEITKLRNQIKNIFSEYMSRMSDNKFRNFLCRILRKKYKEAKEDDETTTTTTETDSDETDSVDNGESEFIYLDENVCPPGCDKTLYNLAFLMRENRYAYEHEIRDAQRAMEILHKEIQIHMKKLKVVESSLKKNEDDLKMFMVLHTKCLKKQRKLNDVDVTVLMKLHQLQYFEESQIPFKVHDCVVFDKKKLSKLYARIQELHEETLELQVKHKYVKLTQHLYILYIFITDIKENYAEELVIFNKLIREHTQKLSFLTLLVEERSKLQKLSKQRIMSDEEMLQLEEKYKSDIIKLESILENQMRQKYLFRNDIKNLRLKTKSQHPAQFKEIISSDKGRKICYFIMFSVISHFCVFK